MIKYQKPMDTMDTMDLNGDLEGSTPINFNQVPPQAQQNQGPQVPQGLVAPPPQIKEAEKNLNLNKGGRRMRKVKSKSLKKRRGRKSIKKGVKKVVKKGGRKSVRKSLNKRGRKSVRR